MSRDIRSRDNARAIDSNENVAGILAWGIRRMPSPNEAVLVNGPTVVPPVAEGGGRKRERDRSVIGGARSEIGV
jgi:hypothetical protein